MLHLCNLKLFYEWRVRAMHKESLAPLLAATACPSLLHCTRAARTHMSMQISVLNAEVGNASRMETAADVEG